jgi:hypothetical protein
MAAVSLPVPTQTSSYDRAASRSPVQGGRIETRFAVIVIVFPRALAHADVVDVLESGAVEPRLAIEFVA